MFAARWCAAWCALVATVTVAAVADACTEVQVRAPTGELVIANALEAGRVNLPLALTTMPRGSKHGGHYAACSSFTARYGFVAGDGMNEAGLAVNEHALDLAVFQQPEAGYPTVCTEDFASWAMGLHGSIADLVPALATIRVVGQGGGQWGVQDATGASVVIEYVKGVCNVHNNTVGADNSGIGVMTNDPTWDWHLQNVNNYAALQPGWYGGTGNNALIQRKVPNEAKYPWATNAYDKDPPVIPSPIGHAYNLLGLPGDGSPPSRFIRAFYNRGYALLNHPPTTLNETLVLGQELLNSVYKTLGTVAKRDTGDPMETTPISSLKVLDGSKRMLFFRSREDMQWRLIDLARIDWGADVSRSVDVTTNTFSYTDVTADLR